MKYTAGVTIYLTPKRTQAETLTYTFDTIDAARIYAAGMMVAAETIGRAAEYRILEQGPGRAATIERGDSSTPLFDHIP